MSMNSNDIFGDTSERVVRNSGLFPFRYYQAYKAVKESHDTPNDKQALSWLEHAMEVSCENLPDVFDNTFTAVDVSASMITGISGNSNMSCMEIGTLFGAMMLERDSDVGVFASRFDFVDEDPRNPLVTNSNAMRKKQVGGSTNGYKIFQNIDSGYEQIIVFTDMQLWNSTPWNSQSFKSAWDDYKSVNPQATLYLVDLAHYGDLTTPDGSKDVYNIQGWSSKVLDFIDKMENVDEMVQEIESYEP